MQGLDRWYAVDAQPYGGCGKVREIARCKRGLAGALCREYGVDDSPLDSIGVGSWYHIGVPRQGLLTITRLT